VSSDVVRGNLNSMSVRRFRSMLTSSCDKVAHAQHFGEKSPVSRVSNLRSPFYNVKLYP
jgi:hypothetical protein